MKNNFDSYIAIDWSGAEAIYTKSIAVAEIKHNQTAVELIKPIKAKLWSRTDVYKYLLDIAKREDRVFVGIDANFSYAQPIIHQQLPHIHHAFDLWEIIDNICKPHENFYTKNFWSHPDWSQFFWTQGTSPPHFPREMRQTETACIHNKLGYPENPFKLIGAKQVGKGGVSAMRMMHQLRQDLGGDIALWPFDSQNKINSARLVCAEIFPRLFIHQSGFGKKKIREHTDLNSILSFFDTNYLQQETFSDHEADALISSAGIKKLFDNGYFSQLPTQLEGSIKFEGWILGV